MIRPPSGPTTSSSGVPPTVADDHRAISLSPCSPTIEAWTLVTPTPSRWARRWRSRDVSSTVPLPITRLCGKAGDLLGDVRDDVDGVRHEQVDGVGRDLEQRREHAADEPHVGAGEVEPWHAGAALRRTCRDDDEVGVGAHADVATARDVTAADELQAVAEVEHLRRRPRRVDVVDGDLVGDAIDHAGICDGAADAPGADDGDLVQPGHRPTVGEYRRPCGGRPRPRRARRLRTRRHRRRGSHPPRTVGAARPGRRPVRPAWRDAPVDRTPRPGRVPDVGVLRPLAARRRAGCRCPRADLDG